MGDTRDIHINRYLEKMFLKNILITWPILTNWLHR